VLPRLDGGLEEEHSPISKYWGCNRVEMGLERRKQGGE